jgi:hypothetical protein
MPADRGVVFLAIGPKIANFGPASDVAVASRGAAAALAVCVGYSPAAGSGATNTPSGSMIDRDSNAASNAESRL